MPNHRKEPWRLALQTVCFSLIPWKDVGTCHFFHTVCLMFAISFGLHRAALLLAEHFALFLIQSEVNKKKKKNNGCDLVAPLLVYWIFFPLSWSSKAIVILLIEQYYLSKWQWKQFHLVKAVWTVRSWRSMDCNFTNLNQSFRSACLSWENQLVQHFPRTVCKGARNLWRELWNLCANKICAAWKSVSEKWILWIFFPAFVFCRGIKMTT